MGGSKIFVIVFLGLFSLIKGQKEFGDPCIGVSLCNKSGGLVCGEDNTCVCTSGAVTSTLQYSMAWDNTLKKCFGQSGSACVGTPESPNPAGVECAAGLTCTQVTGLPVGLGSCALVDPPRVHLTYGQPCNSETYCDKAAGLICDPDFKCGCSSGAVTENLNFVFEWNAESNKCLASVGSACVGTKQTPIVAATRVECVADASCEEPTELRLPVGVGVCTSQNGPDGDSSGIINKAGVITLTLAGFMAFTLLVVQ